MVLESRKSIKNFVSFIRYDSFDKNSGMRNNVDFEKNKKYEVAYMMTQNGKWFKCYKQNHEYIYFGSYYIYFLE